MKKAQTVFVVGFVASFIGYLLFASLMLTTAIFNTSVPIMFNRALAAFLRFNFTDVKYIISYVSIVLTAIYCIIWILKIMRRKRSFVSYFGPIIFAFVVANILLAVIYSNNLTLRLKSTDPRVSLSAIYTIVMMGLMTVFGLLSGFNGISLDSTPVKSKKQLAKEEAAAEAEAAEVKVATVQQIRDAVRLELSNYAIFGKGENVNINLNFGDVVEEEEVEEPVEEVVEEKVEEQPVVEEVVNEEPALIVTPIVEEKVEEVVEEKVEEQPVVVAAVEPADDDEEDSEKKKIIRVPFDEKLLGLDQDMKDKYNDLKNYALSYGIKSRVSNSGDTFRLHKKMYLKITVAGKGLKLYFALNPADYADSSIPVKDASGVNLYKEIPAMFKVKSELSVKRAKQLIDDVCLAAGRVQGEVNDDDHADDLVDDEE